MDTNGTTSPSANDDDIIQSIKLDSAEKDRVLSSLFATLGDDTPVYRDTKAILEKMLSESQRKIEEIVSMRHTIESQHRTIRELTRSIDDAAIIIGEQERTLDNVQMVVDEQNRKIEGLMGQVDGYKKAAAGTKGKGRA